MKIWWSGSWPSSVFNDDAKKKYKELKVAQHVDMGLVNMLRYCPRSYRYREVEDKAAQ